MKSVAAATTVLIVCGVAWGQTVEECVAIADDSARLECYDLLHRKTVSTPLVEGKGKWSLREETSRIDDSKNVFLSVSSMEPERDRFGQPVHLTLMLRCMENTTTLTIHFGGQFMSDLQGAGEVTYRVDNGPANHKSFAESNNHEHLGLWTGSRSIPFIKELLGGSNLYIRAVPYSESAMEADFPIAGLENAILPLRDACGW